MSDVPSSSPGQSDSDDDLRLVCLQGGLAGRRLRLRGDRPRVLGRAADCDIPMNPEVDRSVSGRHVEFSRRDGRWWVRDLGSSNGTRLNRRPLTEPSELNPGDVIERGGGGSIPGVVFQVGGGASSDTVPPRETVPARPGPPVRLSPPPSGSRDPSPAGARRRPDGGVLFPCGSCGVEQTAGPETFGATIACTGCGADIVVPIPLSLTPRSGRAEQGGAAGGLAGGFGGGDHANDRVDRLIGDGLRRLRRGVDRMRSGPRRKELERELAELGQRLESLHQSMGRRLLDVRGLEAMREHDPDAAEAVDAVQAARVACDQEQERIHLIVEATRNDVQEASNALGLADEHAKKLTKDLGDAQAERSRIIEARVALLQSALDSIASTCAELGRVPDEIRDPAISSVDHVREVCERSETMLASVRSSLPDLSDLEEELARVTDRIGEFEEAVAKIHAERTQLKSSLETATEASTQARALGEGEVMRDCRRTLQQAEHRLNHVLTDIGRRAMSRSDPEVVTSELATDIHSLEARATAIRSELAALDGGGRDG